MGIAKVFGRGAPIVAVTTAVAMLAAYAVFALGNSVERPDLNNSGIWASNDLDQTVGRFNKSASAFEKAQYAARAPGARVDVHQDGNTVVAQDRGTNTLAPIDSLQDVLLADKALPLPANSAVELRGGTLAVLDKDTGKLWAIRTGGVAAALDLAPLDASSEPIAELGAPAALSVAADGSVDVAATNGKTLRLPVGALGFGAPVESAGSARKGVQVAALGAQTVVFDPVSGVVSLPGGATALVPGSDEFARVQLGGADVGAVLVATTKSLVSVSFDGQVTTLYDQADGNPAPPVALGGYRYGTWAGGTVVVAADGQPGVALGVDTNAAHKTAAMTDPVFRVNWGKLLVNDRADGRLFDIDLQLSVDDWPSVTPTEDEDSTTTEESQNSPPKEQRPVAKPDKYSVRALRTSVLHVLDNDSDPNGHPLSILPLETEELPGGARATVSPDGQTILFTQPKDGSDAVLKYTVLNLAGKTADAEVRITAAGPADNAKPALRENWKPTTYQVASGGSLQLAVAADYRDPDCDPVTVHTATPQLDGALASVSSDGLIDLTAPATAEDLTMKLDFEVTDGPTRVKGSVDVLVAGDKNLRGRAPVANADAARGEAGSPITFYPLANDLPGVDPANPHQKLTLAAKIEDPAPGVHVDTDLVTGRVSVTTAKADFFTLNYMVAFGSAPTASAEIRVDVTERTDEAKPVVAMPDVAVIRGKAPAMVDVLANDFDPRGGLLTVQTATPEDADLLSVGIVKGRWVRVVPNQPENDRPTSVTYQVTNGDGSNVTGSIAVTQFPGSENDAPVLRDDSADVRAGDSVLIPVLLNDASADGTPLALVTNDVERAGEPAGTLEVTDSSVPDGTDPGDIGTAYVSGTSVRYVAPASVEGSRQFQITYRAHTATSEVGVATATVTVHPAPDEAADNNQPPAPSTVEARVVLGDTTTIQIPSFGQDPDGDTVTIVGLASMPTHGRVLSFQPDGIEYQAYPNDDMAGTDEFSYTLTDRYGKTGDGVIRVAIVPPGQTQPPMPVDDEITARPGAAVTVDPLSNDFVAPGDPVVISQVSEPGELAGDQGPVTVAAPADGETTAVSYTVKGNSDSTVDGKIAVTGKDGYVNPPRIKDQVAQSTDGKVATVDVLTDAWDPDSAMSDLRVELLDQGSSQATLSGSTVSVPVTDQTQILAYRVTDEAGGQAVALIFVRAADDGLPFVYQTIKIGQNESKALQLGDYVKSRRDRSVRITTDDTVAASPAHVEAVFDSLTSFTLTSRNDYVGPAAVSVRVTDGSSLDDPEGKTTTLSIPVQVGAETPVLHCPTAEQTVQIGMDGRDIDLTKLCHVWVPDGMDASALTYTAAWTSAQPDSVDFAPTADKRGIRLSAGGDAMPDATGTLSVSVDDTQATPSELRVRVLDARKLRIDPITAEVQAGQTATAKIAPDSPFDDAHGRAPTIISIKLAGATRDADAVIAGEGTDTWSVTPAAGYNGKLEYAITVSDVANTERTNRWQETTLTVTVYNVPGKPEAPQPGKTVQSQTETLTWPAPAANGAKITKYVLEVEDGSAGPWTCAATKCVAKGLTNGHHYRFRVQAWNKAGEGPWSEYSAVVTPDKAPTDVTDLTFSEPRDHSIKLSWPAVTAKACNCVVDNLYYVIIVDGQEHQVRGATEKTITGLDNVRKDFTIYAVNDQGRSPNGKTGQGTPTGPPGEFAVHQPSPVNSALDEKTTPVRISWDRSFENGQGPVLYSVTDNGRALGGGCANTSELSCVSDAVSLGSGRHTFEVTATNAPAFYKTKASASWEAEGNPPKLAAPDVAPTGANQTIKVSGTSKDSFGPAGKSYVEIFVDGQPMATPAVASTGADYSATIKVSSPNGTKVDVTARLCYTSSNPGNPKVCGPASSATPVTPFGPLGEITLSVTADKNVLNVTVGADANGANATLSLTHGGSEAQCKTSKTGAAKVELTCSMTIDWADTRRFTATFTSSSTTPSRSDQTKTATKDGNTPNPPALSLGNVSVSADGEYLNVSVTGNGNGLNARLTLNGNNCNETREGSGELRASCRAHAGYSSGVKTYTAKITNLDPRATGGGTRGDKQMTGQGETGAAPAPRIGDWRMYPAGSNSWGLNAGIELWDWDPNSRVRCFTAGDPGYTNWDKTFTVNGDGYYKNDNVGFGYRSPLVPGKHFTDCSPG